MGRVLARALAVVAVIAIVSLFPAARSWLSRENIYATTQAMGAWGPAILILAGVVGPLVFIPRAPICFVGGLLYGVTLGSILGMVAGTAGSILQYYLSIGLLARSAKRLTPPRWQRSISALRSHPFRALLLLRLFPLSNASLVNMISGLLRLPLRPFVRATVLGTLPITIIYAFWGQTARQPKLQYIALSMVFLFGLTLIASFLPRLRGFQH